MSISIQVLRSGIGKILKGLIEMKEWSNLKNQIVLDSGVVKFKKIK